MPADWRPDVNGDPPEFRSREEFSASPADGPDGGHQPAERRDRADYYQALRSADRTGSYLPDALREVERGRRSGWDDLPPADRSARPELGALRLPPDRAAHILDGDRWGGGHRHGTGRPGKTEFPPDWDDERVIGHIADVARFPDERPVLQANQRWRVRGERDGVEITVIVHPDARIWAGWPEEGSPGVIRNPREGQR